MEFFLPGAFIFLVAILVTYFIVPHFTPFITIICSIIFLTFGVYTHYHMFASEYRLSTWQEGLKLYAPAIMIGAIILFIIYGMIATFTGVKVPVPALPDIEMPNTNSLTNSMINAYNTATNNMSSITNNMSKSVSGVTNSIMNSTVNASTTNSFNKKNNAANGIRRSALETI